MLVIGHLMYIMLAVRNTNSRSQIVIRGLESTAKVNTPIDGDNSV